MPHTPASKSFLGSGIVAPFRRSGRDFVVGSGAELVRSALAQILGTEQGELPWDPKRGTRLARLRHMNMNEDLAALVGTELQAALAAQEPRVELLETKAEDGGNGILRVSVIWQLRDRNAPGNQVLLGPEQTEVSL